MTAVVRHLWIMVLVLGVVALAMGAAFIYQGIAKENLVQTAMRQEKVTYLLPKEEVAKGNVIDTAEEAQMVADTIKQHRQSIAPTYDDLLAGGKYDPTDSRDLTYTQGLNLQNAMNMAVLSFGVVQQTIAVGAALVVIGLAVGAAGLVLLRLDKQGQS